MCSEQNSNNDEQQSGISRRDFMKFMGVGAVGVSLTGTAMASGNNPQPPEKFWKPQIGLKFAFTSMGVNMRCWWNRAGPCYMSCGKALA